jgi:hypothetical protein
MLVRKICFLLSSFKSIVSRTKLQFIWVRTSHRLILLFAVVIVVVVEPVLFLLVVVVVVEVVVFPIFVGRCWAGKSRLKWFLLK